MVRNHTHSSARRIVALVAIALALTFFVSAPPLSGQGPRECRDYAGGPDSSRFVPATQIDKSNVGRLQVAWTYPSGQSGFNPIVVRGVIYTLGRNSSIVALDAATGKELWVHEGLQGFNG